MEFIIHRVNSITELLKIPQHYGCEIDLRTDGSKIILHHDALKGGEDFLDYLDNYTHGTLVLNIKESGIEDLVLDEIKKRPIDSYFLLDMEFPYLFQATLKGERSMAVRFSEKEPVEAVREFKNSVDWVWIDTITKLPINADNIETIGSFKTCMVCPERWGRPQDIPVYKKQMEELSFKLDAVMTSRDCLKHWEG